MIDRHPERERFSLLSDKRILEHIESGGVIIDPFEKENLGTVSYDVRLGEYYYREQAPKSGRTIYNPWNEQDVRAVWGEAQTAEKASSVLAEADSFVTTKGISGDDKIILINPGETILSHTQEFIGGRGVITTMMKARSSIGRNFIEVCKCAGWGDVGYINRWTMEITNNSRHYTIPLVAGRRVAQITFFEVGQTLKGDYSHEGKYQTEEDIEVIKANWKPDDMLPKMWKDREVNV